jgi:hypothetical protein
MSKNIIDASMLVDPSIYSIVSTIPPSEATIDWIKQQYNG